MSSYKEESKVWTAVRTSSFIAPSAKKDNDTLSPPTPYGSFGRKESLGISMEPPNRISAISSRQKSIDLNLGNGSPPISRSLDERRIPSISERNVQRRDPMNSGIMLKTTSATACIATSNYAYPVVNVNRIESDAPPHTPQPTLNENPEDASKAQKREHLRTQRDNLNWDLCSLTPTENPPLERKESTTSWKPTLQKGADVECLMNKVWNKQYKEAELYINILGAEVHTTRSLATTEVTIKIQGKVLGTFPYGKEIILYVSSGLLCPSPPSRPVPPVLSFFF
jgi:hypothetical protein